MTKNTEPLRLGFPVKILGEPGLKTHDSRRWQNNPHLRFSLDYLDDVLKYVEKLRQVDVTGVDAATDGPSVFNVFRADAPRDWFTAKEALSNAPRQANGLFVVPKVVE